MSNPFKPDNPFFNIMSRIGDFILLNFLFIIFCIPIFTIGASLSAMYKTTEKISENKDSYITKDFFRAFKENFKNSTIMWLFYIIAGGILIFVMNLASKSGLYLLYIPCVFLLSLYIFSIIYAFPLQATFINSPLKIIINSAITSLKHFNFTIILTIIIFFPLSFTFLLPALFPLTFVCWLFFGFSTISFVTGFLYRKVFLLYK